MKRPVKATRSPHARKVTIDGGKTVPVTHWHHVVEASGAAVIEVIDGVQCHILRAAPKSFEFTEDDGWRREHWLRDMLAADQVVVQNSRPNAERTHLEIDGYMGIYDMRNVRQLDDGTIYAEISNRRPVDVTKAPSKGTDQ
jgi:hypothetical protein